MHTLMIFEIEIDLQFRGLADLLRRPVETECPECSKTSLISIVDFYILATNY